MRPDRRGPRKFGGIRSGSQTNGAACQEGLADPAPASALGQAMGVAMRDRNGDPPRDPGRQDRETGVLRPPRQRVSSDWQNAPAPLGICATDGHWVPPAGLAFEDGAGVGIAHRGGKIPGGGSSPVGGREQRSVSGLRKVRALREHFHDPTGPPAADNNGDPAYLMLENFQAVEVPAPLPICGPLRVLAGRPPIAM